MNAQKALEEISQGFAIETIGKEFFYSLSDYLSKALKVAYVFIGELTDKDQTICSLVFFAHGKVVANLQYPLVGSLCEHVVRTKHFCAFPRNVQEQFPKNKALKHFGVDSYVGIPLLSAGGRVIGLVYLMDEGPMEDLDKTELLLTIMAKRAAMELERDQQDRTLQAKNAELEQVNQKLGLTQEALRKSNQHLEEQVENRTQELLAREEALRESFQRVVELNHTLTEREAFLSSIVNQTSVGIAQVDLVGKFTFANESYCKMVGYSLEELQSRSYKDITHFDDLHYNVPQMEQLIRTGQSFEIEKRYVRKDGSSMWALINVSLIGSADEPTSRIMAVCQDITRRKQAEQQLQTISEELVRANQDLWLANEEIKDRNEELATANQQLLHINADLDNFIYTASHDLKAPILNIEGLMKVLSRRIHKLTGRDEPMANILSLMENSVNRFKETITDLTDIARVQKQTDQVIEQVDLTEIVNAIAMDLEQQIQESGTQIESHLEACPAIVFARKNLKSVVYNLLSNAIKYRNPGREPHIVLTYRQEDRFLVLSVEDNGLGMEPGDTNKIFDMFKRLHAHVDGTGIGLYIVKKVLENAGGKIEVDSQVGVGTTFKVYFKR